ncbi:MAG: bifunctional 3,4-dihydroxy-2-butanone-4-phosphate synthase/GTP cyclohydrolase II, partial [Flavobacteriales bacterium]|nr:bifunctional 3,4-dihydroxy-2-butanone-4-phosphate synthase/GTP cyclohydrolase II [Flavobacteriales bacterium]
GVLVFINHLQEGLWEEVIDLKRSLDQADAPEVSGKKPDNRDFGTGAQILRDLGVHKMTLLTSHSVKRSGIEGFGLEITSTRSLDM